MSWMPCPMSNAHSRREDMDCPSCFYACTEPERPHETHRTCYGDDCRVCLIAAEAAVRMGHGEELGYSGFAFDDVQLGVWLANVKARAE